MNDKSLIKIVGLGYGLLCLSLANAAGLSISDTPLYVTQPLPPNVIISPVYNTEYNEAMLRKAPWIERFYKDCDGTDIESPCITKGKPTEISVWNIGEPFYGSRSGIDTFAWRVTPWPEVTQVGNGDLRVTSDVALYHYDNITLDGVTQFRPLDYVPGKSAQTVTEEQYPESTVVHPTVTGRARYLRSDLNFLYFNKTLADSNNKKGYLPWPDIGGYGFTPYQDAKEAVNPYYHPLKKKLQADLSTSVNHLSRRCDNNDNPPANPCVETSIKTSDMSNLIGQYWTYQNGNVWNSENYKQTIWENMDDDTKVNFAHWFTYWRSADLAARGMMARLVDTLSSKNKDLLSKLRLGIFHNHIEANGDITTKAEVEVHATETDLIKALADIIYKQTENVFVTPVWPTYGEDKRAHTKTVWEPAKTADYFKTEAPYRDDPHDGKSSVRSCRRNYEIVLTPDYTGMRVDMPKVTMPDEYIKADALLGKPYAAERFSLSDAGAYGWATDLMPGLSNNLLPGKYDKQTAQHVVRYAIGPSDDGVIFNKDKALSSYDDALQVLTDNPADGWYKEKPNDRNLVVPVAIDDLWHMVLNSRGFFYQGENIGVAVDKLLQSLNDILVNNVSGSSVAANTTSFSAGGNIYQATVESDWKGHLRAYTVTVTDNKPTVGEDPAWDLAEKVSAQSWDARNIATYAGGQGVPFLWANIGDTAQALLKTAVPKTITDPDAYGGKLLEYLRGSAGCEDLAGHACASDVPYTFRRRNIDRTNTNGYSADNANGRNVLGDVANSNPWFESAPPAGRSDVDYPGYNAYRVAKKARPGVLYVGANDGMLHAVNASDGSELFAYVPSFVQTHLYELASAGYAHKYFVDGSPFAAEVDWGGDFGWRTVLAGGGNKGGKGYYLLDVTDPTSNTEAKAKEWVKWEFTHPEMYYTFNLPVADTGGDQKGQARQITRMNDGKLALIVGNGYPEAAGAQACLFIIYLTGPTGANTTWTDKTDYHKICVGDANYTATGGLDTNGLSTPTPYDRNGDGKVDVIFAGDLNGNLWRFDVQGNDPAKWGVAYAGDPLFVAKNAADKRQPIISPPEVASHAEGTAFGYLVLFGTGKYIEIGDRTNTEVQSFYGVWDRGLSGITRSNLLEQKFQLDETSTPNFRKPAANPQPIPSYCSAGKDLAVCTADSKHLGWYWDMPTKGERLTGQVNLINGIVLFNTFYPGLDASGELDPCLYGGDGWLMGLDAVNGTMEDPFSVFDVNQDGVIDSKDALAAGLKLGAMMGGTSFADGRGDTMFGIASPTNKDATGKPVVTPINAPGGSGRVSWFELLD